MIAYLELIIINCIFVVDKETKSKVLYNWAFENDIKAKRCYHLCKLLLKNVAIMFCSDVKFDEKMLAASVGEPFIFGIQGGQF